MQNNNLSTQGPISEFSGLRFFLESLRISRERRHLLEGPGVSAEAGFYLDAFRDRGHAATHIAALETRYETEEFLQSRSSAAAESAPAVADDNTQLRPDAEDRSTVIGDRLASTVPERAPTHTPAGSGGCATVRADEFVSAFVAAMDARPRAFADVRAVHVLGAVEIALAGLGQGADFTSISRLAATLVGVYEKLQKLQAQSGATDEAIMKSARREFLTVLQARASFRGRSGGSISFR